MFSENEKEILAGLLTRLLLERTGGEKRKRLQELKEELNVLFARVAEIREEIRHLEYDLEELDETNQQILPGLEWLQKTVNES